MEILPTIVQDFRTLKSLADKAIAQVPDQDLRWQLDMEEPVHPAWKVRRLLAARTVEMS